eukprot:SAG31_NODE_29811_length_389_cov_1.210345_1_plen_62_part_10
MLVFAVLMPLIAFRGAMFPYTPVLLAVFSPMEDLNIAILVGDSPIGRILTEAAVGLEVALGA